MSVVIGNAGAFGRRLPLCGQVIAAVSVVAPVMPARHVGPNVRVAPKMTAANCRNLHLKFCLPHKASDNVEVPKIR